MDSNFEGEIPEKVKDRNNMAHLLAIVTSYSAVLKAGSRG